MKFKFLILLLALLGLQSCGDLFAGGASEETNAIAGVVLDSQGKPVVGAVVAVRHSSAGGSIGLLRSSNDWTLKLWTDEIWKDTTDRQGRYRIETQAEGDFAVLVQDSLNRLALNHVQLSGQEISLTSNLQVARALQGHLDCRLGSAQGSLIYVLGTDFVAMADSNGDYQFPQVPQGDLWLHIQPADAYHFAAVRVAVQAQEKSLSMVGPLLESYPTISLDALPAAMVLQDSLTQVNVELPWVYAYELRAWWNMDALMHANGVYTFADLRGQMGKGYAYGGQMVQGVFGFAVQFQGPQEFAVIEPQTTLSESGKAITVEAWIRVDSLPDTTVAEANLLGKLGWTAQDDFFSLALHSNSQGQYYWAFLMPDSQGLSLDNSTALRSLAPIVVGEWTHLLATWNGVERCFYVQGELQSCQKAAATLLDSPAIPIIVGKEDLVFSIDEIRIVDAVLSPADAQYHWLRRFP